MRSNDYRNILKAPWFFVLSSQLITGFGLFLLRKYITAGILFLLFWFLFLSGLSILVKTNGDPIIAFTLLILSIITHVTSLILSYKIAKYKNYNYQRDHNKAISTILFNVILPGAGFFVFHRWIIAIIVIISYFGLVFIEYKYEIIVDYLLFIMIIIVCYRMSSSDRTILIPIIASLAFSLQQPALKIILDNYISDNEIIIIDGDSNYPTIYEGDIVLSKNVDPDGITRCELISFYYNENTMPLIKRVVALQGDTIQIKSGIVQINGAELNCSSIDVNYHNHGVLENSDEFYVVPNNSVFLLGDNSNNSFDSRYFGSVSLDKVSSSLLKIIWPVNRTKLLQSYQVDDNE